MQFIEDKRGNLYPISQVWRITPSWKPHGSNDRASARVYLVNGDDDGVEIYDGEVERLRATNAAIVAATPGYSLLAYWFEPETDDAPFIDKHTVIAWAYGDYLQPITLDYNYNETMKSTWAVLSPDGTVYAPSLETGFENQAGWEAHMKKLIENEQARKSAIASARAAKT